LLPHRLLDQKTRPAPALSADSWIARRSSAVEPEGTQTMICGVAKLRRLCALRMKCFDHFLRYLEIGYDAVAQRPDRLNVARSAADHQFRLLSDGEALPLVLGASDCDHRRLIQDDTAPFHLNDGVCRAEVDRHAGRQQTKLLPNI
jgi:hypothetical protein